MSLIGIGSPISTLEGFAARAESHMGDMVTVKYSQEALEDFGSGVIWPVAENKYSDGKYDTAGEVKVIKVTTADCQKWMDDNA